jgi:hypothetical protein
MAGAPLGNKNGAKAKQWSAAIERALERRTGSRAEALDELAEKLLAQCDEGSMTALKELGDRLDGKAAQSVFVANEEGEEFRITHITRTIVKP